MMEYSMEMKQKYLGIPVYAEEQEEMLEIFDGGEKIFEFQVPVCQDGTGRKCDYYSYLNIEKYRGRTLVLRGNLPEGFFGEICQTDSYAQEPLTRPLIHFTAQRGWINDPNGLVYHNGRYHLFFQYNPMNTRWQNMSWGHAIGKDLLHFEQVEDALYPDEHGTMYSGCGLVNERGMLNLPKNALLFYYTAAGGMNEWSKGKEFTQRIAYSTDEGETLVKLPEEAVGVIEQDSRDPKIFWHEETQAYIMVLWLCGNKFGFLRSENLKEWNMTDSIELAEAWECPDLFCLECGGEPVWVFMSADGFYYLGQFDGYHFRTDGVQKKAYITGLPYAAQTYSGTADRIISVPWLRTHNAGKLYTGMMGLPRELHLEKRGEDIRLALLPVREYEETKETAAEFALGGEGFSLETAEDAVTEIVLEPSECKNISMKFFHQELAIRDRMIFCKEERTSLPEEIKDIHILIDRGVLEIYANNGTLNVYYETDSDVLRGKIEIKGGKGTGKICTWKP
ncbi:glycoside hydrolase family 32 protein [Marvinbryantia formatexigens]|nr:glycoside hydrolase family 32 protein [Marvinbryantia formatexigens]UWO23228.1 glycoside hydrolase family 32 protein [Marvinbryantia formatexigens DSM 14469]